MRFPVYESLSSLNRKLQDILVILEEIKKAPGMPRKSFEAYQVEIQYLRCHATLDVLEVMNNAEIHEMAKLGKQKRDYEDSIRDVDDVYFEVQNREEQRRKQGLPSLIGVLPVNYQPSVPETDVPEDEIVTSEASPRVRGQNRIEPSAYRPHAKSSAHSRRARRRPERAS